MFCLIKSDIYENVSKNNEYNKKYVRVSKIYCIDVTCSDCTQINDFKCNFIVSNINSSSFLSLLENYKYIVIDELIFEVNNIVKKENSIEFQGTAFNQDTKNFIPLTSYHLLETFIKRVSNKMLWVLHISEI
jgi:hypothetical protein